MKAAGIHTLGKTERLKSRKTIAGLFAQGKKMMIFPFRLVYLVKEGGYELKAGFTVSSANFPKAVDRNRIKRLSREAYRLQKSRLEEMLKINRLSVNLFFIYTGRELPAFSAVQKTVQALLNKLIHQLGEGNA